MAASWSFTQVGGVSVGTLTNPNDGSQTATALQIGGTYLISGIGDPSGIIPAPVGSVYYRQDGIAGTVEYRKVSGVGTSGWLASGAAAIVQNLSADGAITALTGVVILSKSGAGAYTIAAPTAVTDDGKRLTIITTTAQAHVITSAVDGFNAKGSSGTVTFTAAIGNSVELIAFNGHWYAPVKTGVTLA